MVGFKQLPEPTDVLGCPRRGPGGTTVGYAGKNAVPLLAGFSCCRKQFLSLNQALEEENNHQIIFS